MEYVLRNWFLWEHLTCLESLKLMGDMYEVPGDVLKERAQKLLEDLLLTEKANTGDKFFWGDETAFKFSFSLNTLSRDSSSWMNHLKVWIPNQGEFYGTLLIL